MAKIYAQGSTCVWGSTASLLASACTSGSFSSHGYARLVGGIISSGSLKAASGLRVRQSWDNGSNWDYEYRSTLSACSGSAYSIEIIGDYTQIEIRNGADNANVLRTKWWLRPV